MGLGPRIPALSELVSIYGPPHGLVERHLMRPYPTLAEVGSGSSRFITIYNVTESIVGTAGWFLGRIRQFPCNGAALRGVQVFGNRRDCPDTFRGITSSLTRPLRQMLRRYYVFIVAPNRPVSMQRRSVAMLKRSEAAETLRKRFETLRRGRTPMSRLPWSRISTRNCEHRDRAELAIQLRGKISTFVEAISRTVARPRSHNWDRIGSNRLEIFIFFFFLSFFLKTTETRSFTWPNLGAQVLFGDKKRTSV